MRILLLTHAFNSLSQRLYIELRQWGHEVSIEFDVNDAVTAEAIRLFQPDLILAPFLKRAIAESVWKTYPCIIVHPGIEGDRGPSSLDWAILNQETHWGVTCLQADAEMDAGPIWASVEFPMRKAKKSSLYRHEVTEAAVEAVRQTLDNMGNPAFSPRPLNPHAHGIRGQWRNPMAQSDRAINWRDDTTATILRKVSSADGVPGLRDTIAGTHVYLYDARPFAIRSTAMPGTVIARGQEAICCATRDGAIWFGHLRLANPGPAEPPFKLPATRVLTNRLDTSRLENSDEADEIRTERVGNIALLHFPFYNGAMSTRQCQRLNQAYQQLLQTDARVIVLMGGEDFFSNGIHLNTIEAAESPADESWQNINAMNDLCRSIITTRDKLTVSALQGNAGAGGVFLALAADQVFARDGIILNPHYKGMGNLYGSEYWTYRLPRRVGTEAANQIIRGCLPLGTAQAAELGLVDQILDRHPSGFYQELMNALKPLADDQTFKIRISHKQAQRQTDEASKPLENYREEELKKMHLNFYGFDPSYHFARYHFVHRTPKSRTPSYLAHHR